MGLKNGTCGVLSRSIQIFIRIETPKVLESDSYRLRPRQFARLAQTSNRDEYDGTHWLIPDAEPPTSERLERNHYAFSSIDAGAAADQSWESQPGTGL